MFYFYYTHFAPTIQKNSGVPKKNHAISHKPEDYMNRSTSKMV